MNPGRFRHWVDLGAADADDTAVYAPARVKCLIQPTQPGAFDEQKTSHVVQMRYHPQVSFNTKLTFVDRNNARHELFIKGIQNVNMMNRELVLACEEVMSA